jgi:hypothetical protein
MNRFEGVMQLAGLIDGPAPQLDRCSYELTGKASVDCEAGCEGDGCFFIGSVDMMCHKDRNRCCPDDEDCCNNG